MKPKKRRPNRKKWRQVIPRPIKIILLMILIRQRKRHQRLHMSFKRLRNNKKILKVRLNKTEKNLLDM